MMNRSGFYCPERAEDEVVTLDKNDRSQATQQIGRSELEDWCKLSVDELQERLQSLRPGMSLVEIIAVMRGYSFLYSSGGIEIMSDLQIGTQIIYVPSHAKDDIYHPDCETGFVAGELAIDSAVFCRYWVTGSVPRRLRTVAGSELTLIHMLVIKDTVPQQEVEDAMRLCG